ncbi:MAG: hypothetical protein AB8E15_06025 [Bdellovibrionales bacterium]
MNKYLIISITLVTQLLFAELPEEVFKAPELVAIQNKSNYLDHDLSVGLGLLPSDAFNKGVTLGVSYTYFYENYSAWEIIQFRQSFNLEQTLKTDLIDLGVDLNSNNFKGKLDYIDHIITTSWIYTPYYSKTLMFNSKLINNETSFRLSLGGVKFKETGYQPLIGLGAYTRYYTELGRSWKLAFDLNIHFDEIDGVRSFLYVGADYSFQLGDPPKYLKKKAL